MSSNERKIVLRPIEQFASKLDMTVKPLPPDVMKGMKSFSVEVGTMELLWLRAVETGEQIYSFTIKSKTIIRLIYMLVQITITIRNWRNEHG